MLPLALPPAAAVLRRGDARVGAKVDQALPLFNRAGWRWRIIGCLAWYHTDQLTVLCPQCRLLGLSLVFASFRFVLHTSHFRLLLPSRAVTTHVCVHVLPGCQ